MLARFYISVLLGVLWLGLSTPAQALVAVPRLAARVTDQTATLSAEQVSQLEQRLQQFEAAKGSQIALLIVPTTNPEAIEQYSIRVVEVWKIGRKGVDDGVLLVVAKNDRTVRIEVGYSLEGALPDATANRIIDEIIVPRFKQGEFFAGVSEGLDRIMKVIEGEPLPPPRKGGGQLSDNHVGMLPFLFFGAIILGGILRAIFGRFLGATVGGVLAGLVVWFLLGILLVSGFFALFIFLMILFSNSSGVGGHRSSGGGFSSGGFSGGGGGFSGGGGSFGGGGASGRW